MTTYYYYKNNFDDLSWGSSTPLNMDGYNYANIAVKSTSGSSPQITRDGALNITEIVIKNIYSIPDNAFLNCPQLTDLTIGEDVITIGVNAFYNCTSLINLTIGGSVKTIGNGAFEQVKITTLTIPTSVETIGNNAFYNCTSLINLTIGDSVKTIGTGAFEQAKITTLIIPPSVETIGNNAFYTCTSLKNVILTEVSASKPTIDANAFNQCSNFALTIQKGTIVDAKFSFKDKLEGLTLGNDVVLSGSNNFSGCSKLNKLTIGSNVTSIPGGAFQNCLALGEVVIPPLVTFIGTNAFASCKPGLNVIILNDTIVLKNESGSDSTESSFYTENTTLYINKTLDIDTKDWIFGTNKYTCTVLQHSFLSFSFSQIVTYNTYNPLNPSQIQPDEANYIINTTSPIIYGDFFPVSGEYSITKNTTHIKVQTITGGGLLIPLTDSINLLSNNNITKINELITHVANTIQTKLNTDCTSTIVTSSYTSTFNNVFKRISADIGAKDDLNLNKDVYVTINGNFPTYKDYISSDATSDNFKNTFITYFTLNDTRRLEFLNIFNLFKYASIDVNTYRTYKFYIYAKTEFAYGDYKLTKMIKIN